MISLKSKHSIATQLQCVLLITICPATLLITSYNGNTNNLALLAVFCLFLLIINAFIHFKYLRELDFFSPNIAFTAAYITILSVGFLTLYAKIGYYTKANIDRNDLYYYLVGLICYIYGNIFAFILSSRRRKPFLHKISSILNQKNLFEWSYFLVFIGTICAVIYFLKTGVPLFGDVDRIRHGIQPRTYGLGFSMPMLQGLNFIFLIYLVYSYKNKHFASWILVPILWISFLTLLTGYRWVVILFILVPVTGYHYIVAKFKFKFRGVIALFLLSILVLSLFGFAGYQRKISKQGGESRYLHGLNIMNIPAKYKYQAPVMLSLQVPSMNFSNFKSQVPGKYDYFCGKYLLAQIPILQRIIPAITQERIGVYITDTILGMDYRGGDGGSALTIVGSFYADYGLCAIIVGMGVLGFCLEIIYLRLIKTPSPLIIAIYSILLWSTIKWIVAGFYIGDLGLLVAAIITHKLIISWHKLKVSKRNI